MGVDVMLACRQNGCFGGAICPRDAPSTSRGPYLSCDMFHSSTRRSVRCVLTCALAGVLLSSVGLGEAAARHIVGGEVTYMCVGQPTPDTRTYEIRFYVYRDANGNGAQFDSNTGRTIFHATIFRGTTNPSFVDDFEIQGGSLVIDELPLGEDDECIVFPPNIDFERGYYRTTVTLPVIAETYTIAYQRCCRNERITNIVNPGQVGSTYFTEIPPVAQQTCNSSPVFRNFPPIVICQDVPLRFDPSATDADGDSLVYKFCEPVNGGGPNQNQPNAPDGVAPNPETPPPYLPVAFLSPFSFEQPLDSDPVITVNASSGQLRVNPQTTGLFLLCVTVEEWRDGVLIGEVRRDFQFSVVRCDPLVQANLSSTTQIDSLAIDFSFDVGFIQFCGTKDIELVNTSSDPRYIDEIRWRIENTVVGTFESGDEIVTTSFPEYGTYPAQLIVNPDLRCTDTLDFRVRVTPPTFAEFAFAYDTCIYGPVEFTNGSSTEADSLVGYRWDFGDGTVSRERDPAHAFATAGTRTVTLTATDNFGCDEVDEAIIQYFPVPAELNAFIVGDSACAPAEVGFRQGSGVITDEYDVFWDFGDGTTSSQLDPDYRYAEPGQYNIYVSALSPFGCFVDTQLQGGLVLLESPTASFELPTEPVVIRDPVVQLFDASEHAVSWQWDVGGFYASREEDPVVVFPDTGLYDIDLVVSHLSGCFDSVRQQLRVLPYATYHLPNAFSPNGDGDNEGFRGVGYTELLRDFRMQIFSRWGELVFETDDVNASWDGKLARNGGDAQQGVYLYVVTFADPDGEQRREGYVTLVR